MAGIEGEYEAFRERTEAEGNEVALVQMHKRMNHLRDTIADLLLEVTRRMERLEAEAQ